MHVMYLRYPHGVFCGNGNGVSPTLTLPLVANNRRSSHYLSQPQAYQRQASFPQGTHVHIKRTMSQTQTHTDSVDGQEHDEVQKKAKSRRPASKLTIFTTPQRPVGPLLSSFFRCLTKASRLYRYCLPAAAFESMAVSSLEPPTSTVSPLRTTY